MNGDSQKASVARCKHYLQRAHMFHQQNNVENYRNYYSKFVADAQALTQNTSNLDEEVLYLLYKAGEYETLLSLFHEHKQKLSSDTLPLLAASIYFIRKEPHNALLATKYITDIEQRRLRQKTAELWTQIESPLATEPRVHLLILTHNREQYVAEALRQLAQTDYTNYAVFIADNGSQDNTLAEVNRAISYFPSHVPVSVQSFPTNLGRPVGHNWLLTGHDHSTADYIAIGDDDLTSIPSDWLRKMIQTAKAFPNCGCVGGKAITPGFPARVHAGIRNFTHFEAQSFNLTNGDEQDDIGQFDFIDIVDHVIGCLHIFDRKILNSIGLFDISLSPCQCVDIEHHLRMRMAGHSIVFNGLIHFEHMRGMGNSVAKDKSLAGNSLGNVIKILYKHNHEEVQQQLLKRREERNKWLMQ